MTPILPDNAPFNAVQRAWLNGFFAGMLGIDAAVAGASPMSPALPSPAVEEDFPWHDPIMPLDERMQLAEGKPVERVLMAAMAQQDCGQCGYLCQTYAEAIASGAETSLKKCVPGGKETAKKLKEILAATPIVSVVNNNSATLTALNGETLYTRDNPYAARLLQSMPLNKPDAEKETRYIAIDLDDSGLVYEVGDALGVYPHNRPDLVQVIMQRLGANGDEGVTLCTGKQHPLREALLCHCDITRPSDELFTLLVQCAADPDEAERLKTLSEDCGDRDVLDLLEEFPSARPGVAEFITALAELQPRLYSISSSLKAHRNEVHLTVAVVRYTLRGRERQGVASGFLARLANDEKNLRIFIQASHGFRLPSSPDTPIIMVGPGTGVAPFRAFLEERKAQGAKGKNWLFFGSQRSAQDFLYQEELEAYRSKGLLTHLNTAFSRDQQEKIYVQHQMLEHAKELWAWLQEGAYFYVCGDAKRMANDVDKALQNIVTSQGGLSAEAAKGYVKELAKSKRYLRDVY